MESLPQNNNLIDITNGAKQPTSQKPNNSPKRTNYAILQLSATLQLNKKDRMLYVSIQFREYEIFGVLDTGAIQSALSEAELKPSCPGVQSPNLQRQHHASEKTRFATFLHWQGGKISEETLMFLLTIGNVLIGMSFFKKYSVTLKLAKIIVQART